MSTSDGTDDVLHLADDAAFVNDPHTFYARLRDRAPARRAVVPGDSHGWLITRYADVRALLTDPRVGKDHSRVAELTERHDGRSSVSDGTAPVLVAHMLNTDPPDHTRLRKLVNHAFTARSVEALRPRIEEITTGLLDEMAAGPDEVDLLSALASPLPMRVICEVLGVPRDDRQDFRDWLAVLLGPGGPDKLQAASDSMLRYLTKLIADKRANPGEDLLTALCQACEDDDRLSESELVSMSFLLLVAGHDTTVNLIGNGVLGLLRNPDQLATLRADPSLLPAAIEEFLRHDGPLNIATPRYTNAPVTVGDVTIPEGEFLLLALGAANRDPRRFPDPDRLDVTRPHSTHLAFGHGIHYCVGAPLGRMEGGIAVGQLLRRFPNLELAVDPAHLRYRASPIMRGLERLPVRIR